MIFSKTVQNISLISNNTKRNNANVKTLSEMMAAYANEFGIEINSEKAASYLFTSNLKELSGAVLHMTVLAFKLAYIQEIQKVLKIRIPIILDSPSGKEVDKENIKRMIDVLQRDFSENQIIIASIYRYDFVNVNIVPIVDHLMDTLCEEDSHQ